MSRSWECNSSSTARRWRRTLAVPYAINWDSTRAPGPHVDGAGAAARRTAVSAAVNVTVSMPLRRPTRRGSRTPTFPSSIHPARSAPASRPIGSMAAAVVAGATGPRRSTDRRGRERRLPSTARRSAGSDSAPPGRASRASTWTAPSSPRSICIRRPSWCRRRSSPRLPWRRDAHDSRIDWKKNPDAPTTLSWSTRST